MTFLNLPIIQLFIIFLEIVIIIIIFIYIKCQKIYQLDTFKKIKKDYKK